ncbi:flagellar assembly protein FliH [Alkalibacillus flavidus]|uniref:Flagellar assembly protein FliH n=1 Tax=Alkalibacillus flavidus TaxID=546021 RepID=A0ABV2KRZ5_9BACI
MSNLYRLSQIDKTKKIQLKPIDLPEEPVEETEDETEVDYDALAQEKVQEAEQKLEDAQQQADQMIQDARAQIEQEREQFEAEKQKALNQAHEQGYQDGFQQGEGQFNDLINQATQAVERAQSDYHNKVQAAEETILSIAVKSAEKILHQQLHEDESRFLPVVQESIEDVSDQPEIKVYVHVNQYQLLLDRKQTLQQLLNQYTTLSIYPKKTMDEYGCVIETEQGQIDTSIDTRLNELKRTLIEDIEG